MNYDIYCTALIPKLIITHTCYKDRAREYTDTACTTSILILLI